MFGNLHRELGEKLYPVALDVTDAAAVRDIARALLAEFSAVEVLVNNAGHDVGGRRLFEQVALGVREDRSRFGSRSLAAEHRQPCHPPGDDAAKRNAVGQAIGRGETRLPDPAAGLQGSEKSLDLPAQGVPSELVHGVRVGRHRQVRDQFPDDGSPALRRVEFLGMNDLEFLMPVFPLLSDRKMSMSVKLWMV